MFLIRTHEPVDGLGAIYFMNFMPEQLSDEDKKGAIIIEGEYQQPDVVAGKVAEEYYDYNKKEIIVKYVDAPKTTEQIIAEQAAQIASINYSLMMGGLA